MNVSEDLRAKAADTLRTWALDEGLKARVMADPRLHEAATAVARRYMAGEGIPEALSTAEASRARGHLLSIECVGESIRDAARARQETEEFLRLAEATAESGLPATISFDLSHLGSSVSPELGLAHAHELAEATARTGTPMMISAEGSERTDTILDLYETLAAEHDHIGVTLQARLHRTPRDVERVLALPGTIRLVKGAFLESERIAHPRGSAALIQAYLELAATIIGAGHPLALATHDPELVGALIDAHGETLRRPHIEFEMLMGLGTELLDRLAAEGYRTREYLVYGSEWWLYVLNRIAEHPERAVIALADLARLTA